MGNSARTTKTTLTMGLFNLTLLASDGSANTSTVQLNAQYVQAIGAPSASEIVSYPTAAAAVTYIVYEQNTPKTRRLLTASTQAAVTALVNASNFAVGSGVSGQTALVAGTKAITIQGLTTASLGFVQLVSPSSASSTIQYKAVCTADTLTITALVAAGTINASDVSTVNYAILG